MVEWVDWLLEKFKAFGNSTSWIVNLVQLFLWTVVEPFLWTVWRKKRNRRDALKFQQLEGKFQQIKEQLDDEMKENEESKDKAYAWHGMTREAVKMMKERAPALYKEYTDFYGGEENFTDWWELPDRP